MAKQRTAFGVFATLFYVSLLYELVYIPALFCYTMLNQVNE